MRSGELRHKFMVQAFQTTARDSQGGVLETWIDIKHVWGKVEGLSGREFMEGQQISDRVSHKITLRYMGGLTAKHRLLLGGKIYNVVSVRDPEGRRRTLEVMALEGD